MAKENLSHFRGGRQRERKEGRKERKKEIKCTEFIGKLQGCGCLYFQRKSWNLHADKNDNPRAAEKPLMSSIQGKTRARLFTLMGYISLYSFINNHEARVPSCFFFHARSFEHFEKYFA